MYLKYLGEIKNIGYVVDIYDIVVDPFYTHTHTHNTIIVSTQSNRELFTQRICLNYSVKQKRREVAINLYKLFFTIYSAS